MESGKWMGVSSRVLQASRAGYRQGLAVRALLVPVLQAAEDDPRGGNHDERQAEIEETGECLRHVDRQHRDPPCRRVKARDVPYHKTLFLADFCRVRGTRVARKRSFAASI